MCGRYALYGPRSRSRAEHEYFESLNEFPGSYNVAPTDTMPICRLVGGRPQLSGARWGLVPADAPDLKSGAKRINAPAQHITRWSVYRAPYRAKRRCLVPASGFYEWQLVRGGKQPYHVIPADEPIFAFAGLWEEWRGGGEPVTTYTIITADPNDAIKPLHDRMPVILAPEEYDRWLTEDDPRDLLRPCHNEMTYAYPVSSRINSVQHNGVKNDEPFLIEPIDEADRRYLETRESAE